MEILVHVISNAKTSSVEKIGEGEYRVRVDAPATEGKANKRLIALLARYFGVAPSLVVIAKGQGGRVKRVVVLG